MFEPKIINIEPIKYANEDLYFLQKTVIRENKQYKLPITFEDLRVAYWIDNELLTSVLDYIIKNKDGQEDTRLSQHGDQFSVIIFLDYKNAKDVSDYLISVYQIYSLRGEN